MTIARAKTPDTLRWEASQLGVEVYAIIIAVYGNGTVEDGGFIIGDTEDDPEIPILVMHIDDLAPRLWRINSFGKIFQTPDQVLAENQFLQLPTA